MALSAAGINPISAPLPINYEYFTSDGISQGLNADQSYFTLNDKLIRIYSGAMHYFRVPRAYWRDRLRKIRAAGLNTVETYVPWNLHEPQSGKYDFGNGGSEFEDFLHLEEFLKTAREEDLFVIVRPGPYICSEFNFGGFPTWLLREESMGFRTSETTYMKFVTRYFNVLLTLLAAFQFTQGGPIIAFQVENEYGNVGDDKVYLEGLRQLFINNGVVELLVTADNPLGTQGRGTLPGIFLQTANFGDGATEQLNKLEELQPGRPLMVMEFWDGWFDFWATNHTGKSDPDTRRCLGDILAKNASFNAYMFFGGTNFAFNNGAGFTNSLLDNSGFQAVATTYDYDAPLSENGNYRDKYYIFKEMVAAANPVKTQNPDQPEYIAPKAYGPIKIEKVVPYQSIVLNNSLEAIASHFVLPMEKLDINNNSGQSNGYIVYRKENIDLAENSVLTIEGNACDHNLVLVNGQLIAPKQLKYISDLDGFGFWKLKNSNVTLNKEAISGATLDIIVEEMGRVNGGIPPQYNQGFKGLWQGNVSINNQNIYDWKITPLELKKQFVNELQGWEYFSKGLDAPAMYGSILTIEEEPLDTFVDVKGWGKGMVFVNGFPLGKYAAIGPQRTLYLPAPFLRKGVNQINFFEHFYVPTEGVVNFSDKYINENVY